jgi:cell fate regulator YaaT (PSP1 superfamily)
MALSRRVVGVQFRRAAAMIYDFDAADLPLTHDTRVVVETERGEAVGWTVGVPEDREPHQDGVLRRILRVAAEADQARQIDLQAQEKEALRFCARKARELGLPMKVIAVEWAHSGEKAAFYFSSEERIDFRTLVRDLAQHFRVRVEMRQVGPRDEAKIIGAMGPCGRETCCSSWMRAFTPVSIKMAKDQGLSITPAKVTGVCGRLLCCLAYEQDTYRDLRRKLPKYGKQVMTPRGPGRIVDVLVLRERVRVALDGETAWVDFAATEVKPVGASAPQDDESEADPAALSEEVPAEAPVPARAAVASGGAAHTERPAQSKPFRKPGQDAPRSRGPEHPATSQRPSPSGSPHERGAPDQGRARQPQPPRDRPPRPQDARRDGRPERPGHPAPQGGADRRDHPQRQDAQRHGGRPERSDRPPQRDVQNRHQGRPERPPRPPPPEGAASNSPPAESTAAPVDGTPAATDPQGEQGRRSRHRHRRRRGGGGGGQDSGGPESPGGNDPTGS